MASPTWPSRVVLVEPRDARNVGMAARACANFGVTDLAVVHASKFRAALERAGRSEEKARKLGLSGAGRSDAGEPAETCCVLDVSAWKGCERLATGEGAQVLQVAQLYGRLEDALAGTVRAVAFTGRSGDNFRRPSVALRELARQLAGGSGPEERRAGSRGGRGSATSATALVFGSEDVGLSTAAVLLCGDVCRLSTAGCPSLNLSHAVAVVLARIHEEAEAPAETPPAAEPQEAAAAACPGPAAAAEDDAPAADACLVPVGWTAAWAELCRARLEVLGYPAQADLWHGRGRRRCRFTYRLFCVVATCVRSLQRAGVTAEEAQAWQRLVGLLTPAGQPARGRNAQVWQHSPGEPPRDIDVEGGASDGDGDECSTPPLAAPAASADCPVAGPRGGDDSGCDHVG